MDTTRLFQYQRPAKSALGIMLACGATTAAFGYIAMAGYQPLGLCWTMFGISGAVTTVIHWMSRRLVVVQNLQLTDTQALVPRGPLSGKLVAIPYEAISKVQAGLARGRRFLIIHAAQGRFLLMSDRFVDARAFAEFYQALAERLRRGPRRLR